MKTQKAQIRRIALLLTLTYFALSSSVISVCDKRDLMARGPMGPRGGGEAPLC